MNIENDKTSFDFNKEIIVQTTLMYLHEKINSRMFRLHQVCKLLYLAIIKMEDDRKLVKPTYQKWVSIIEKMKQIELCVRVNPNAPLDTMPIV